jgi:hypothetical protein
MTSPTRAPLISKTVLSVVCLAFACLAMTASALAAIHFQKEGLPALNGQLGHHEVHALSFHPSTTGTGIGHVHVSLNDGRHMTVEYAASEQAQLIALGRTDRAAVTVAKAKPKPVKKAVKHKLRYIAAGILVVVIVVVAAVLLIDRRRKLGAAGGEQGSGSAHTPSPGESG